ncbi:FH2 domain-containing protein 1-like [Schistocerca serialis cubense]|uniref:FH2 domain-containing protein 1-like n=1 Tax=Schistocerca serialis cubense TaxID=2023355 RepID=UPI00214E3A14|nr:FH2 domain-containing protein 1-like [Schistocerca serialis cubense]
MLLKEEFPSRISELKEQLKAVADACNKLKANKRLKEFLALVLQLGNYINAGSYAGNAAGFTLSTLPKLLEIKANKPRLTFLHYVVEVAEANNKEILQFTEDMSNMKEMARISVQLLQEEVMKVTTDVKQVKSQLKEDTSGIRSQFKCKDFFKAALKCSNELQHAMNKVKACTRALAKHFCEDPKKFKPEECFQLFAEFFTVIERVRQENEEKRKEEQQQIQEQMETNKLSASGDDGGGAGSVSAGGEVALVVAGGVFMVENLKL